MNLNKISASFRLLKYGVLKPRSLHTESSKCKLGLSSVFNALSINSTKKSDESTKCQEVYFSPRSIVNISPNVERVRPSILDIPLPTIPIMPIIPNKNSILDIVKNEMECPTNGDVVEKLAIRLIVIRRRKMRKHKLKKLRKRMKFEWRKRKQRRELLKEKAFQAILVNRIKEAEAFLPEKYVNEKLKEANYIPFPTKWKGKTRPDFVIKQRLGLAPKINTRGIPNGN